MSVVTIEVDIDHGTLKARQPHLLPETGSGVLTIVSKDETMIPAQRKRVELPLIHCVEGTVINPTPEELDDSFWD